MSYHPLEEMATQIGPTNRMASVNLAESAHLLYAVSVTPPHILRINGLLQV